MERYANRSGSSDMVWFELRKDGSVAVCFRSGDCYLYDSGQPGLVHVEQMRQLAIAGEGLGTYIHQFVRARYRRRVDTSELDFGNLH